MSKNLYHILGVSKDAGEAEIKSAYHKLARKYHPDVNKDNPGAAEKFKEISCAYDILGNAEKRQKYDRNEIDDEGKPTGFGAGFGGGSQGGYYHYSGGSNPFGGNGNGNFDFSSIFGEDIFSQFGGSRSAGANPFGGGSRRTHRGENINYNMPIDFMTAVQGGEQAVSLNGKKINVKIPVGTVDGQTLRLKGLGSAGFNGGANGDVLITLSVRPHPYFELKGLDIHLTLPISVREAVLGGKITVPTISGKVNVTIPPYSSGGEKLRLKGKGIKNNSGTGDEIITLNILAPHHKNHDLEKVLSSLPEENVRNF